MAKRYIQDPIWTVPRAIAVLTASALIIAGVIHPDENTFGKVLLAAGVFAFSLVTISIMAMITADEPKDDLDVVDLRSSVAKMRTFFPVWVRSKSCRTSIMFATWASSAFTLIIFHVRWIVNFEDSTLSEYIISDPNAEFLLLTTLVIAVAGFTSFAISRKATKKAHEIYELLHPDKKESGSNAKQTSWNNTSGIKFSVPPKTSSSVSHPPSMSIAVPSQEEETDITAYGSPASAPLFEEKERLVKSSTQLAKLTQHNIHAVAKQLGYVVDYSGSTPVLATPGKRRKVASMGDWVSNDGKFQRGNKNWEPKGTYTKVEDAEIESEEEQS